MGPLKKESMEVDDSRLGCQNEKGKKERRGTSCGTFDGTVDDSFSRGKEFKGVVILLGSRECVKDVTTSVKDS